MLVKTAFIILICAVKFATSNFTGYIVGGELAKIEKFPYSVFVSKKCNGVSATCGASILNQAMLLTAGHCVERCIPPGAFEHMEAYTGSEVKFKGHKYKVIDFKMHDDFDNLTKANDIALLKLEKELTFGTKVKRISLMKEPPNLVSATIAGWGWIDSVGTRGDLLKEATQELIDQPTCSKLLGGIPLGTICGKDLTSYPEKGDSGSALIVDEFIQIGIVSFKKRSYTNSTIIYTDVSYFYDWIMKNAANLNCKEKEPSPASETDTGSREKCHFGRDGCTI